MGVPPEAWSQLNMSPGNLARRIERGMVSPSKAHEAYTSSEVDTVPKPTNQSKTPPVFTPAHPHLIVSFDF